MKSMKDWEKSGAKTFDEFFVPGDIVSKDVVEYFRNSMPPVTDYAYLMQAGSSVDFIDGKNTYTTFENTVEGWKYKGDCHKGESKTPFEKWLDTFIDEKGIDLSEEFKSTKDGFSMTLSYQDVIDNIKTTTKEEQSQIKNKLVQLDFYNSDIKDFLRHLSTALIPDREQVEELEDVFGESIDLTKEPEPLEIRHIKEDLYLGFIKKEDLYNYSMKELKEVQKEIENDIKEVRNNPTWKIVDNIEEEATSELQENMEKLEKREQNLHLILEDVDEVIKEKELEGEEEEEDEL